MSILKTIFEYLRSAMIVFMIASIINKLVMNENENWWWISGMLAIAWIIGKVTGLRIYERCEEKFDCFVSNIENIILAIIIMTFLFGVVLDNIINPNIIIFCAIFFIISQIFYSLIRRR